jgi:hypothetical protein
MLCADGPRRQAARTTSSAARSHSAARCSAGSCAKRPATRTTSVPSARNCDSIRSSSTAPNAPNATVAPGMGTA